jgi:hypothetical protein
MDVHNHSGPELRENSGRPTTSVLGHDAKKRGTPGANLANTPDDYPTKTTTIYNVEAGPTGILTTGTTITTGPTKHGKQLNLENSPPSSTTMDVETTSHTLNQHKATQALVEQTKPSSAPPSPIQQPNTTPTTAPTNQWESYLTTRAALPLSHAYQAGVADGCPCGSSTCQPPTATRPHG